MGDEVLGTFADRRDAGRRLAARLEHLTESSEEVVVVGLPRGGVPVAAEVAAKIGAPLDVILVRKLGVPQQPELALGALGEDDVRVINHEVVQATGASRREIAEITQRERASLNLRAHRYRPGPRVELRGRTVVVVDDGVATGSTARAACQVVRAAGAHRIVLAVPVASADWTRRLAGAADEYVAVLEPRRLAAIGQFYRDFTPTSDDEVVACLRVCASRSDSIQSGWSRRRDRRG
jgi:putative phosphoribosyl transferase